MKTIKQIANENKTYKQKIFRIIKKNNIVTKIVSGVVMVGVTEEKEIIKALNEIKSEQSYDTVSQQSDTEVILKEQIKIKDLQLEEKDKQIKLLLEKLDQEQKLHLATIQDKQQLQIELKEIKEEKQQENISFWDRIFNKK